jgi:hypothetical protein
MNKDIVNYKNILVIGNGFDLNLGLKTAYSDYLSSVNFQELLGRNSLARYLNNCKKTSKWVDIEKELYNYSNSLFYKVENNLHPDPRSVQLISYLRGDYYEICCSLREYLKKATTCPIDFNDKAAYKIVSKVFTQKNVNTYILTFNYTEIIERLHQCYFPSSENFCINHIHGSLQNNNIVFGIEDSAEVAKKHVFLYKSYNTTQNINGLISVFENAKNITFFCYSLGETDHSYFDDFFNAQTKPDCDRKKFTFYYYGQEAYDDLIWQLKTLTKNRLTYLKQYNQLEFHDVSRFK